ncbi:hypothetical protein EVAR_34402_1 [Eumeta japonica]|uniref:Uncharacterized protein n=1 Tax=Eumeta variegata TaxID=151549 RepID=A0A4C1WZP7_EUMVA|nr:hypothetical protein EVAR_34402_1 [Eumeta japonica]
MTLSQAIEAILIKVDADFLRIFELADSIKLAFNDLGWGKELERTAGPDSSLASSVGIFYDRVVVPTPLTELKIQFHQRYGSNPRVLPTLDQLVKFLEKEYRLLDNIPRDVRKSSEPEIVPLWSNSPWIRGTRRAGSRLPDPRDLHCELYRYQGLVQPCNWDPWGSILLPRDSPLDLHLGHQHETRPWCRNYLQIDAVLPPSAVVVVQNSEGHFIAIGGYHPIQSLSENVVLDAEGLQLADPEFHRSALIDLLLGAKIVGGLRILCGYGSFYFQCKREILARGGSSEGQHIHQIDKQCKDKDEVRVAYGTVIFSSTATSLRRLEIAYKRFLSVERRLQREQKLREIYI